MNDNDEQIGFIAAKWASVFSTKLDDGFTYDIKLSKKDIDKSCNTPNKRLARWHEW